MSKIVAIYGSPRRKGNTARLLSQAVAGAREAGAAVEEIVLRDLKMSPCLEIYKCKEDGRCAIQDDFHWVAERICGADGLMIASPVFFYAVSAHTKILMDRSQSLWVKKYWIDKEAFGKSEPKRRGLFISVGATRGKKLFDGVLMSMKYFLDVYDTDVWQSLLYRGLDFEGDVQKHPAYLTEAYQTGRAFVDVLASPAS